MFMKGRYVIRGLGIGLGSCCFRPKLLRAVGRGETLKARGGVMDFSGSPSSCNNNKNKNIRVSVPQIIYVSKHCCGLMVFLEIMQESSSGENVKMLFIQKRI